MPRVPIARNTVDFPTPGVSARVQAPDMGAEGDIIGRSLDRLGSQLSHAAIVKDSINDQYDQAAAKEAATHQTAYYTSAAYDPDHGLFHKRGKDALDASGAFQKGLNDNLEQLKKSLKNPRQQHYFDQITAPQMNAWAARANEFVGQQQLNYSVDQAASRADTSLDAFGRIYNDDPAQAEEQLHTALGEIEHAGKLQGWSEDQIKLKQSEATSKAYAGVALQRAVTDPIAAFEFVDRNEARMDPDTVTRLRVQLQPKVWRQQGIELANHLGSIDAEKTADGLTHDPLAPLPNGETPSPTAVWSRIVGPDGRGGIEGGTNPDGSFRTSPKGAIGPAQVMPGTAREAAAAAGLSYDEQRYKHDAAYNLALGRGYFNKMLAKFGNPIVAAAAYNAGPGTVAAALRKGGPDGWTAHLPAETKKYVAAIGGATGGGGSSSPRGTLGEQLRTLESLEVPEEVKDSAREVLTRRAQTASIIAKEEHDSWLNDFELSLHDGTAGKADIEAARKAGRLTDYDEITRAESIVEAREKESADLTNFNAMIGDPHFAFNQYDDGQRKAVEAGVKAMGGTPAAAFQVWQKTGILAKSGAVALRGALVSTNAQSVRESANIAGNMLRMNPNAFAGVEGQGDIEHAAVAFNHYVFDLGMDPGHAAQRVAQENDPKLKEKVKYTDPQRQEAMKTLRQNGGAQAQSAFKGADFPNPEAREEANQTYHELITDNLANGLDLGSAQAQAQAQLRKVYGVNARGRIVKYAPEAIYPPIGGSYAYIYKDAERTVKQETGRDPVAVNLVPIPGVTDQDFRNGRPARYRLLYSYKQNGQTIVDAVPGQFAADTHSPAAELSTHRRRSFAQERRFRVDANRAVGPNPTVLPGIGVMK